MVSGNISKKKLKKTEDFLCYEPYRSIINILRTAPEYNKVYRNGLQTKELRELIIKEYNMDIIKADQKRYNIFENLIGFLQRNYHDEVVLNQDIKPRKKLSTSSLPILFNDYLQRLEKHGWISRKNGYCSLSKKYTLNNIFKERDITLIQNCPVNNIFATMIPYRETEYGSEHVRSITYYDFPKRNLELENILDPLFLQLRNYIDNFYSEKLRTIITQECSIIKNKNMKELINNWYKQIIKEILLHPSRTRGKLEPIYVKFEPPENYREEFKEITEGIWTRFNQECPPIGIVIRF